MVCEIINISIVGNELNLRPNAYELLGISPNAGVEEIDGAVRAAQQKWHPGSNSFPEAQAIVDFLTQAQMTLTNPNSRILYDQMLTESEESVPDIELVSIADSVADSDKAEADLIPPSALTWKETLQA